MNIVCALKRSVSNQATERHEFRLSSGQQLGRKLLVAPPRPETLIGPFPPLSWSIVGLIVVSSIRRDRDPIDTRESILCAIGYEILNYTYIKRPAGLCHGHASCATAAVFDPCLDSVAVNLAPVASI
ncbi:hypothetical protein J6590_004787 [Homalodisca vitripennis]|nr:hypothetical protein J6590_004787 [Homalodisca vitripennis]